MLPLAKIKKFTIASTIIFSCSILAGFGHSALMKCAKNITKDSKMLIITSALKAFRDI
jgi:hypothetical protein